MQIKLIFLSSILFLFSFQTGACCPVHERNQEVFAEVVHKRLREQKNPGRFFCEIDLIGKEALQKGLDLSCYTYEVKGRELCYASFPLWEGKGNADIVFLLFVWPSRADALKCCGKNTLFQTSIHSHPMPCAYSVLLGEISECRYQRLNPCERRIRLCGKQVFHAGEKAVDLNQDQLIHRLLYEGEGSGPAITLHVYGCPSAEQLIRLFESNEQHVYPEKCIVESGK